MGDETVEPDARLVERIAALSDRSALAELHARHGMTVYAIAYTVVFDPEAADAAVAAAFREAWLMAASFDPRHSTAGRWLADLTRRAARHGLRQSVTTRPVPLLVA
jgi:DNA-directed RNA polymerase specialized sigma24 family protein